MPEENSASDKLAGAGGPTVNGAQPVASGAAGVVFCPDFVDPDLVNFAGCYGGKGRPCLFDMSSYAPTTNDTGGDNGVVYPCWASGWDGRTISNPFLSGCASVSGACGLFDGVVDQPVTF
eukprot:TRINITY_DN1825_c0_g1_i1.p2 TRINITY_DN1825_c0_g1~~TRINITY_DN1825_c0_g1_i1.p2  ORF type:complete len:130 (-),score=14.16 TRINITY_DN1825_c0_g1_i1:13-372(-)